MSFTYDPSTPAGQIRLLIQDTQSGAALFQDAEINAFLTMESQSVNRAAARALETVAVNQALVLKRIKLLDLDVDGPAVAKSLMDSAKRLREINKENAADFQIVQWASTPQQSIEILVDDMIRNTP